MTSYAAPMTATTTLPVTGSLTAAPMSGSYVPQPTMAYGATPTMPGMTMDAEAIKKQSGEATKALTTQIDAQSKMLKDQMAMQISQMEAESKRQIDQMTTQLTAQKEMQRMAMEQQYAQQT